MNKKLRTKYFSSLLAIHKESNLHYHCKKEYCCGFCDRFYTCILDILKKLKIQVDIDQKESFKGMENE